MRIDRPYARPEEGEANPQSPDHQAIPAILGAREGIPQRGQGQERADERRPKANDQQETETDAQCIKRYRSKLRSATQPVESMGNRCDPGHETNQQEPDPRRTRGEGGVEPAHSLEAIGPVLLAETPEWTDESPLS
jgi:hypothetical protein